ncbi:hypothetical protein [Pseudomonas poae]|uniref:hypothetical protein n=1 Tax=Pseudomonas poae TaxID=200451 RepID=UPI003D9BD0C9
MRKKIVAIANDGDNAVIALRACQAYVRAIKMTHRWGAEEPFRLKCRASKKDIMIRLNGKNTIGNKNSGNNRRTFRLFGDAYSFVVDVFYF